MLEVWFIPHPHPISVFLNIYFWKFLVKYYLTKIMIWVYIRSSHGSSILNKFFLLTTDHSLHDLYGLVSFGLGPAKYVCESSCVEIECSWLLGYFLVQTLVASPHFCSVIRVGYASRLHHYKHLPSLVLRLHHPKLLLCNFLVFCPVLFGDHHKTFLFLCPFCLQWEHINQGQKVVFAF